MILAVTWTYHLVRIPIIFLPDRSYLLDFEKGDVDALIRGKENWIRVYNVMPDRRDPIPKTLNNNTTADRAEVAMLSEKYWALESANEFFPFLFKDACQPVFRAFLYRSQDPCIRISDETGECPIVKGLVMSATALECLFIRYPNADSYLLFAEEIANGMPIIPSFDYVFMCTTLVCVPSYIDLLKSIRLVVLSM